MMVIVIRSLISFLRDRCLGQLSVQRCPLCRTSFDHDEVRKLHVDKNSPLGLVDDAGDLPDFDELPTAKSLRTRITRIVLGGAKALEVRDLIDEVRNWLSAQASDEVLHADDLDCAKLLTQAVSTVTSGPHTFSCSSTPTFSTKQKRRRKSSKSYGSSATTTRTRCALSASSLTQNIKNCPRSGWTRWREPFL